jgi:hypothetical protein
MSLVYKRQMPAGTPGVHAFISGVSAYRHLPGYQPRPGEAAPPAAANNYGLTQLTSASLSALRLARWLIGNADALKCPLASVRLLLSPQNGQPTMTDPNSGNLVDRCSRAAFVQSAIDWRNDLIQHPDGIALFYFAGHGVQTTVTDSVLLADDFNDPAAGAPLNNAISTLNLYNGLTVHPSRPNIARSQFLFIDACRVMPSQFTQYQAMAAPPIWIVELSATGQRAAPVYYAAQSNTSAAALPNNATLFGMALIQCLENDAARLDDSEVVPRWTITSTSLYQALTKRLALLNRIYNGDQDIAVDGLSGDVVLRTLNSPPRVDQAVGLDPTAAYSVTQVELLAASGASTPCPAPFVPNPCTLTVPAGYYTLKATVAPPATFRSSSRIVRVEPLMPTLLASVL